MRRERKTKFAIVLAVSLLASLCGCAANRTPDKRVEDVSEKEERWEINRNWFCTAKDFYYGAEDGNHVIQRSFDGKFVREYEIKDSLLVSVEDSWLYYCSGDALYRVPVRHGSGSDRLDLEHTEKLLQGSGQENFPYALVMDSGVLYEDEWEEGEVWYYDFAAQKKRRCMKDLLSGHDIERIEFVAASGQYAVITVEFYDSKADRGSVYRTYRYDAEQDKAELLPEPVRLRTNTSESLLFGENLITETWEDGEMETELIEYNIRENTIRTLLTRKQFRELYQKKIQPGLSEKQMDFEALSGIFSDDSGKRVYVEYQVLWHKGTEYHSHNYVVSVSREDGSVRYEQALSEAMMKAVKPRKLIWTNNYEVKRDCLFFAHEVCLVEICNGTCLLHADIREKGKEKSKFFCYDLNDQTMREISQEEDAVFYNALRDGQCADDEYWEDYGCLNSWPNRMDYMEYEEKGEQE